LRGRLDEVHAAGADLVFIGNGSPRLARRFGETHARGVTVLTDPSLDVFRALGMKRSVIATLGPQTWLGAARSLARGNLQTDVQGDPWQQGGLFAMARGGRIVYRRPNRDAAERPDLDAALAAISNR
jgi:uncharacterized protein YjhX (UPF0386 family)